MEETAVSNKSINKSLLKKTSHQRIGDLFFTVEYQFEYFLISIFFQ